MSVSSGELLIFIINGVQLQTFNVALQCCVSEFVPCTTRVLRTPSTSTMVRTSEQVLVPCVQIPGTSAIHRDCECIVVVKYQVLEYKFVPVVGSTSIHIALVLVLAQVLVRSTRYHVHTTNAGSFFCLKSERYLYVETKTSNRLSSMCDSESELVAIVYIVRIHVL